MVLCMVAAASVALLPVIDAFVQHPGLSSVASLRSSRVLQARRPALSQFAARFMGDERYPSSPDQSARVTNELLLSRRDLSFLLAAGSAALLAPDIAAATAPAEMPVVVIGAAGFTGGDTVRTLLSANVPVVASTRRAVKVTSREQIKPDTRLSKDTLVLNKASDSQKLRTVVADALLPETLSTALQGARSVIYCAGSRPKVKVTITPGTNPGGAAPNPRNEQDASQGGRAALGVQGAATLSSASYIQTQVAGAEGRSSALGSVEDVGLVNVAKECVRLGVPRLVVLSSVCAKCQGKEGNEGEQVDKGTASCEICYRKQAGERAVRDLYATAPAGLSYTVVRPGLLSNGETRGVKTIEFNQGLTKSGIISRSDLSEVLVAAASAKSAAGKTFEVYYSDTAQPVDMYASLKSCKDAGKSVKECFFGQGFAGTDTKPVSLDEVFNKPLQGSLFASGAEVQGSDYPEMFARLKADVDEPFDINSLASPSIM